MFTCKDMPEMIVEGILVVFQLFKCFPSFRVCIKRHVFAFEHVRIELYQGARVIIHVIEVAPSLHSIGIKTSL